jgi:hypothetical protein
MTTITATPAAPQPLLPTAWHVAAALAAAALIGLLSLGAERESREAVGAAITTFAAAHVTLPSVEIIGRRGNADVRSSRPGQAVS